MRERVLLAWNPKSSDLPIVRFGTSTVHPHTGTFCAHKHNKIYKSVLYQVHKILHPVLYVYEYTVPVYSVPVSVYSSMYITVWYVIVLQRMIIRSLSRYARVLVGPGPCGTRTAPAFLPALHLKS